MMKYCGCEILSLAHALRISLQKILCDHAIRWLHQPIRSRNHIGRPITSRSDDTFTLKTKYQLVTASFFYDWSHRLLIQSSVSCSQKLFMLQFFYVQLLHLHTTKHEILVIPFLYLCQNLLRRNQYRATLL